MPTDHLWSGRSLGSSALAAAGIDDLAGGFVGGEEERLVGLELEDEAVEDVFEVVVSALDFTGDGCGDGCAVGDGGTRGADDGSVGGDGSLEIGEQGGSKIILGHFGGVCSEEGVGFVMDELGCFIEEWLADLAEGTGGDVELGDESLVLGFEGVGPGGSSDDEGAVDEGAVDEGA